jgi:hypothetical protein
MGPAQATPPNQVTAFGVALGQTPAAVRSILGQRYPGCATVPSIYHESRGYPGEVTAILEVARGSLDVCRGSPEGKDLEDSIAVTFAHPSIAESQPAYQIDVTRAFPDVALARKGKIVYAFEKMRAELFRVYGRPLETSTEAMTSAAADLEKTLAVGVDVKRDDRRVRYLWASQGHLEENLEVPTCDCGVRYVQADLEISRSPSTIPKHQFYVLSLHILIRDAELGARQDKWNAQWQQAKQE